MTPERLVITGLGLVSSLGNEWKSTWRGLRSGRRGVRTVRLEPRLPIKGRGASVRDLPIRDFVQQRRTIKLMAPDARYAVVAAEQALRDAGFTSDDKRSAEIALFVAAGQDTLTLQAQIDSMFTLADEDSLRRLTQRRWFDELAKVNPLDAVRFGANMVGAHISINSRLTGEPFVLTSCPSAAVLGVAMDALRTAECGVALVGGADDTFNLGMVELLVRLGFRLPRTAFEELETDCVLPGSGAAFLVMETEGYARERGCEAIAEIVGYAEERGQPAAGEMCYERALRALLDETGLELTEQSLVHIDSLAGRGLCPELSALQRLAGDRVGRLRATSSRGCVGHLGAAAAFFDTAVSALSLRHEVVPPVPRAWHRALPLRTEARRAAHARLHSAVISSQWLEGPAGAVALRRAG